MDREIITSRQNSLVREVCALSDKKARRDSGSFRFDGLKLLGEAIDANIALRYVFYNVQSDKAKRYVESMQDRISERGGITVAVSESVFDKISEEKAPEGVVSVAYIPSELCRRFETVGDLPRSDERIIIAESLRDPSNLGTVIRSSYALGIDRLVLTDDCAEIYSPKTVRAAMGAAFRIPILEVRAGELPKFIFYLRQSGRRVFATALRTRSLTLGGFELRAGDCFVIGNEGHGLTDAVIGACDSTVIVPMRDGAESLNAAAAAAICIWETVNAQK